MAKTKKSSSNSAVAEVATARVLVLRTCDKNLKSHEGFQWPKSGVVTAPDWNKRAVCGKGLHGLLGGQGNGGHLSFEPDAVWMALWVDKESIVDLDGKVKFPSCEIALIGDRPTVTNFLVANGCTGVAGSTATAGDMGTATAGDMGTATAGDMGTATAGDMGTATAGDMGTATAGYRGTATAGYRGTATAGDSGTATAGDSGTATAGYGGTATAGQEGVISILYWNGQKYRCAVFQVGENGVEPNIPYRLDGNGKPVKAAKP